MSRLPLCFESRIQLAALGVAFSCQGDPSAAIETNSTTGDPVTGTSGMASAQADSTSVEADAGEDGTGSTGVVGPSGSEEEGTTSGPSSGLSSTTSGSSGGTSGASSTTGGSSRTTCGVPRWLLQDADGEYLSALVRPYARANRRRPGFFQPVADMCVHIELAEGMIVDLVYDLETGRISEECKSSLGHLTQNPTLEPSCEDPGAKLVLQAPPQQHLLDYLTRPVYHHDDGEIYYIDPDPATIIDSTWSGYPAGQPIACDEHGPDMLYVKQPVPEALVNLLDNPPYELVPVY